MSYLVIFLCLVSSRLALSFVGSNRLFDVLYWVLFCYYCIGSCLMNILLALIYSNMLLAIVFKCGIGSYIVDVALASIW